MEDMWEGATILGHIPRKRGAICIRQLKTGEIDIRQFMLDALADDILPTKKGVLLREGEVSKVLEALRKAVK